MFRGVVKRENEEKLPKLTLITPTGGRPEAFALCEKYMARQTFIDWKWIVVDDCKPETECTMGQAVIRPNKLWLPGGGSTQNQNLLLALDQVNTEFVAVIEDDDWYSPKYLETLCGNLEKVSVVGELPSRYYNVKHRMFRIMPPGGHASLCQTGFRAELLERFKVVCQLNSNTDVLLWHQVRSMGIHSNLYFGDQVVGIKGLPGRPGAGIGHYPKQRPTHWIQDPGLKTLTEWIGDDVELYRRYYDGRIAA